MYVCVYVDEYAGVQRPEEGVKSSRVGVTGGCKSPYMGVGNNCS